MDLSDVVPLEVVSCSSEEQPYGGSRLSSAACVPVLRCLLDCRGGGTTEDGGWRAERFCEYPQEIVWRVSKPESILRVGSLVIVSDATLIAHRIEIFLSSSSVRDWQQAQFTRLGFITLQSPQKTHCITQELKTVPLLQAPSEPAFIKLLLHTCHIHPANLFNQVGLVCVLALSEDSCTGPSEDVSFAATMRKRVEEERASSSQQIHNVRLRSTLTSIPSRKLFNDPIWIAERNECVSPLELLTRIQQARERHTLIVQRGTTEFQREEQQWAADEHECVGLCEHLTQLYDQRRRAQTLDERLHTREQLDIITQSIRVLDARVTQREGKLQHQVSNALTTHLANSPIKKTKRSPKHKASVFREKDKWVLIVAWQAREEFLWKIVEAVKYWQVDTTVPVDANHIATMDEALEIAIKGLSDGHEQVFIAATTLLSKVIQRHPRFHEGTAWKHEVSHIIKLLGTRLDDSQPLVRNNAAFSIVKVAELTRARGSFVMHTLLVLVEKSEIPHSDQSLYGLLKIFSALLMSYHCCATLDISVNRVLRFLLQYIALDHENGHVREAARELLILLHGEVGSEAILMYLRTQTILDELLTDTEQLLAALTKRTASLDPTPSVL